MTCNLVRPQVSSLISSHLDEGPERHIRQADLRLFWRETYGAEDQVPWYVFWQDFPELMRDIPTDAAVVADLGRLLADAAARASFERAVERRDADTVSIYELQQSFDERATLTTQVRLLVPAIAAADAASEPPAAVEGVQRAGSGHEALREQATASREGLRARELGGAGQTAGAGASSGSSPNPRGGLEKRGEVAGPPGSTGKAAVPAGGQDGSRTHLVSLL